MPAPPRARAGPRRVGSRAVRHGDHDRAPPRTQGRRAHRRGARRGRVHRGRDRSPPRFGRDRLAPSHAARSAPWYCTYDRTGPTMHYHGRPPPRTRDIIRGCNWSRSTDGFGRSTGRSTRPAPARSISPRSPGSRRARAASSVRTASRPRATRSGGEQVGATDIVPIAGVQLDPPIPKPRMIWAVGLNYRDHAAEVRTRRSRPHRRSSRSRRARSSATSSRS